MTAAKRRVYPLSGWLATTAPGERARTVGVVAIRDAADRMAQDLHRRLGDMLVIVCRAGLPQVLQLPGLLIAGLNIHPRLSSGEPAQRLEASIRARAAPEEDGRLGARVLRQKAPEMGMHHSVHRPLERLVRLHPAAEEPPPSRSEVVPRE
jgi:hypothetical protein